MKLRFSLLILLVLGSRGLLAAEEPPIKGAKEVFFNPTDGSVVSASEPYRPAPPAPPAGHSGKSAAGKVAGKKVPSTKHREPAPEPANPSTVQPSQTQTASNRPSSTLGLSYWVELVGADGQCQRVTDQRIFHSGERIRLHFLSNAEGYIALLLLGSSGTSRVLFPDPVRGLTDTRILPARDRILPSEGESAWFRFDDSRGTERVVVLFGRAQRDLDDFELKPQMDAPATRAVIQTASDLRGRKDLILETETEKTSEVGTYAVNLTGKPVVLEIQLRHQ